MAVTREVEVEASPEEVWEAISTDEGRERWLDEPDREIEVQFEDEPNRLVWRWSDDEERATTVEFRVLPLDGGSRVVVTESEPALPLVSLAASFALVAA